LTQAPPYASSSLLADQVRVLGADHEDTLATRHRLAYARGETGHPDDAVAALEELLTDRLRIQGPAHPESSAPAMTSPTGAAMAATPPARYERSRSYSLTRRGC